MVVGNPLWHILFQHLCGQGEALLPSKDGKGSACTPCKGKTFAKQLLRAGEQLPASPANGPTWAVSAAPTTSAGTRRLLLQQQQQRCSGCRPSPSGTSECSICGQDEALSPVKNGRKNGRCISKGCLTSCTPCKGKSFAEG